MDKSPPPPDDALTVRACLDDTDAALHGLIHFIRIQINSAASVPLSGAVMRRILYKLLIPAEALLRRAIHILAALLPRPAPPAPRKPQPPAAARPAAVRGTRPPVFRLTEPRLRPASQTLPPNQRPRISIAGTAPPPAARAKASPEALEARFLRRLEALEYALNDPAREARRLLRRAIAKPPAKPLRPLRPGLPPGLINSPDTRLISLFEQMNTYAARARLRLSDTS